MIQSLEYENAMLSSEEMRVASLLDAVRSLSNLSVLSLPDCIDVATNQTIAADLNACLKVGPHAEPVDSYNNHRRRQLCV